MKIICDFCKTEYKLIAAPNRPVRCAVCGNEWTPRRPKRARAVLTIAMAICALMSAGIFSFVAITYNQARNIRQNPLIAEIITLGRATDDANVEHFVVNGIVKNRSDEIYGVPDLMIIAHDDDSIVSRQKFMAPATLLDAQSVVNFSYTLVAPTTNIKKITVELIK